MGGLSSATEGDLAMHTSLAGGGPQARRYTSLMHNLAGRSTSGVAGSGAGVSGPSPAGPGGRQRAAEMPKARLLLGGRWVLYQRRAPCGMKLSQCRHQRDTSSARRVRWSVCSCNADHVRDDAATKAPSVCLVRRRFVSVVDPGLRQLVRPDGGVLCRPLCGVGSSGLSPGQGRARLMCKRLPKS